MQPQAKYFMVAAHVMIGTPEQYDKNYYLFTTELDAQVYITRLSKFLNEFKFNRTREGYIFDSFIWMQLDPEGKIHCTESGEISQFAEEIDYSFEFYVEPTSLMIL